MRYCLILIHFFEILFFASSCYEDNHSVSHILKSADSLMQVSPDSALLILKSIKYPGKLSKKEKADFAILYSQAQDKLHIRQTSDSLIREAVKYYSRGRNKEREMQAYYYLGCTYRDMRRMKSAIDTFLKSLEKMPKKYECSYLGAIYVKLAACYEDQELYSDAIKMYQRACTVYHEQHNEKDLSYGYRGMAAIYYFQNQLDSSLLYYQKATTIAEKYDDQRLLYMLFGDLARIYEDKKDFQKAYIYISKSIAIAPVKDKLWSGLLLKGRILKSMNQIDSARYYFNAAKTSPYIYTHTGSYYELYDLERKQGDLSAAIVAVDSFHILSDSIQKTTNALEIDRMINKYESRLVQQQLSFSYKLKLLVVCGLAILIIIAFLLKDRHTKNRIIKLHQQLNILNANYFPKTSLEDVTVGSIVSIKSEDENFKGCFKEKMKLYLQLYKGTDIYKRIRLIQSDELRRKIHLKSVERQNICKVLIENFYDLMADLKLHCPSLTNQDILYCIFFMLNCSKYVILLCTGTSEGAFKTRKCRIKEKLGDEIFDLLINHE